VRRSKNAWLKRGQWQNFSNSIDIAIQKNPCRKSIFETIIDRPGGEESRRAGPESSVLQDFGEDC